MTDPDRRVQIDHRSITSGLGISIGHTDNNGFMEADDVAEVIRKVSKHRKFSRSRVAENGIDAEGAQKTQHGFTYRCGWV